MPPHGGGTGGARSKREKDAGAEFDRRGQIRPRYGGSSEPVPMNLADLLPDAPDSVPGGGALPHLRLPSRLFWCLDAWTSFSSRASRLDECVLGRGFFCRPAGDGGIAPRRRGVGIRAGTEQIILHGGDQARSAGRGAETVHPTVRSAARPSIRAADFCTAKAVFLWDRAWPAKVSREAARRPSGGFSF